ncbi:MAG: DUF438 domain-containing protein [Calditrichaceae bacterium]
MSELINNRDQRIETMKGLIRQLHDGKAASTVKKQLESLLDEADYSDVFKMELQLIEEGIPEQSILQLCDTHTNVLRKHLNDQETPQTEPGHPIDTFVQENIALYRTIELIRHLGKEIENSPAEISVMPKFRAIQFQMNNVMDVEKHYRRKENLLFPYFEKKNMPGPPSVMWGKHDEAREMLKVLQEGLHSIQAIERDEAVAFINLAVFPALEALEEMIYKEEKIMFPTAIDLLTEIEWYEIYTQSDEIGYCLYVPEKEWKPELQGNSETAKTFDSKDRIQLPTGSLSQEELTGILNTMPFDLTFVDKDDNVRYFSLGKERIFDRTKAILGRKVQYCHPPSSMHIVTEILEDFKSGRQDQARFWINVKGKFVYIVYYAVRDEKNNYLGTLEVTQEISEIRQLEGERRLLNYDESPSGDK